MQLRQDNTQRQTQSQKIAPQLIQANTLLQCSNMELLQMIAQEQRENPALDDGDDLTAETGCAQCPRRGAGPCAQCPFSRPDQSSSEHADDQSPSLAEDYVNLAHAGQESREDERRDAQAEHDLSRIETDSGWSQANTADSDFNPLMLARAQVTLAEHLLSHLRAASMTADEVRVAEYLVDSLTERGHLQLDLDEACAVLRLPCELIVAGIRRLQDCDPPGIGGRDLRECLLLQMRHLREQGETEAYDAVAEQLLEKHFDALVQRRYSQLARRLQVTSQRIETALAFIQTRLTAYPANQFRQPFDHRPDTQSIAVRPDVLIRRGAAGFEVEVLGFDNAALQLNPHYRGLYDAIRTAREARTPPQIPGGGRLTPEHEKHVVAYVERANLFLKNVQQRRRTIERITHALIECQQGFLETGSRAFLRPLTRTALAQKVGLHESTVSRALLHKYVQLPTQEVVLFDVFFENAVSTKDAVATLIAGEDANAPLSDQAITDALVQSGVPIARRTVVKYREELRIPASYLRRRR